MNATYPLARLRQHLQRESQRESEREGRSADSQADFFGRQWGAPSTAAAAPSGSTSAAPGPQGGGARAGGGGMPSSPPIRGAANPWANMANMGPFQLPGGVGVAGIQVHMSVNGVPVPIPGMPQQSPGMSPCIHLCSPSVSAVRRHVRACVCAEWSGVDWRGLSLTLVFR